VDDDRPPESAGDTRRGRPILSVGSAAADGPIADGPAVEWTPPAPSKGRIEVTSGIVLAGIPTRIAAFLIDTFILVAVSVSTTIVASNVIPSEQIADLAADVVALVVAVGYFTMSWISPWAATPGQRLAGIRIVASQTLEPLTTGRAMVRSLALGLAINVVSVAAPVGQIITTLFVLWPFVLLASAVFDVRRQGFHDRVARTLVVRPDGASSMPLTLGCFLLVLLTLAAPFVLITVAGPAIRQQVEALQSPQP
jgi:uncharacterized RDD family membrane protein YckC